jgi:hypothetical protein
MWATPFAFRTTRTKSTPACCCPPPPSPPASLQTPPTLPACPPVWMVGEPLVVPFLPIPTEPSNMNSILTSPPNPNPPKAPLRCCPPVWVVREACSCLVQGQLQLIMHAPPPPPHLCKHPYIAAAHLCGWSGKPAVAWCRGSFNSSSIRKGSRLRSLGVPTCGGGQQTHSHEITCVAVLCSCMWLSYVLMLTQGVASCVETRTASQACCPGDSLTTAACFAPAPGLRQN